MCVDKMVRSMLYAELKDDIKTGAGVLPIARDTGRALLNYRSSEVSKPYTWSGWGGFVDEGDREPCETALRELGEESGYLGLIDMLESYTHVSDEIVYFNFIGRLDHEFEPKLTWESDQYRWVTLDEMQALVEDMHPKFREFFDEDLDQIRRFM